MFTMPSLTIPESGLLLRGSRDASSKVGNSCPTAFGLTLNDAVIEDMIKCVQNGKEIQLSLGEHPSLLFGTKIQHLATFDDPFHHEIFRSSSTSDSADSSSYDSSNSYKTSAMEKGKPNAVMRMLGLSKTAFKGIPLAQKATTTSTPKSAAANSSSTAGTDAALAALKSSLASENAKKAENTIKYIKDGAGLPAPGRRGAANKSKFLSSNRALGSDTTRSMPVSPALSGVGSPAPGPTSVPLSQQQAEEAKRIRKPLIHELAVQPLTEIALREKVEAPKDTIKQTLLKIADLNESTGKWALSKLYYKELDVWSYNYEKSDDRQRAIDNAVKIYDRSRLNVSDPLWDKLLPKAERGTGKCLSKVQAQIAQGAAARGPKTGNQKSGEDSPIENEELLGDKNLSKVKGGESMARSGSQPPPAKQKKASDKDAQAKRLFSKNPPKNAAKPAPKPPASKPAPKKAKPAAKPATKELSSQYVNSSDEDDDIEPSHVPSQPITKPASKRSRDESESDSSVPLSKKAKKDVTYRISDLNHSSRPGATTGNQTTHRVSDSSHSSRPSTTSSQFSSASSKAKGNSPQKSSPLASSPPTNASESGNSLDGRSSSSASPANHTSSSTKASRSPIHKRHQKSSSVASSVSSSSSQGRTLKPHVLRLANRWKVFYPKYEELHRELERLLPRRNLVKEKDLMDMRERLSDMKKEIMAGIVEDDN